MDIEFFCDCRCLSKWQPSRLCIVLPFQPEEKYSSMAKMILEERGMHSISEQNYGNPNDGVSEESTENSGVNSDTSDRTLSLALKSSDKKEDENLQVEDVILFNKDLNNTENKSCRIFERRVDVTAETICQAEIENLRFKKGTSKFLALNSYGKELEDLTVKDIIISVIAQNCFSTESEVEGLIVKKETAECTLQASNEAEVKDLRVNSETLKITTKTHNSADMEVEYSRVEKGTVDNSAQMSDHAEIEDFRVKKESWEVTAQSYVNAEAENRTVRDGTDNSIHTIASEVFIGKEETVKFITKADFKEEVDALIVVEEFLKITSVATYKEKCDSYRAECYVSEREEEVESYNNIAPSIGLVIGQYFGDCVKIGDLTEPSLQGTYRSEGHTDDDRKNDFLSYQDIHKGRYQQDEFDEIFESIAKKEEQGYEPRERKHALSGERGVPYFLDDEKWSNSYPSVGVQQEFTTITTITSTEESLLLDTEEPHDTSYLKCGEKNEKNSDVSLRNIEIFSDFISLESEKKLFCSELHFRDMGNPSGFVSLKGNKKKKEGLIHLKEGVKLQSSRRQLLGSSVKVFFETGDTSLHQVKDASGIEQQILSDVGVAVQKEKYMAEIDEKTPRDIDLKEKKKHHLRQIVWLPRNWLPLPRLGRDEIVGFVEELIRDGHGGSSLPPAEHVELREILRQLASDNVPGPQITMKYEMLRLCTMKTFPGQDRPFAMRIVGAGFYYAGHKDQVICYCCGSRKEGWVLGDIPLLIHQNMAPDCGFLTHNTLVNVPIRKADYTESPSPTEVRLLAIQRSDGSNQSDTAQGESSLMLPSSEQNLVIISKMSHQMLVTNKSLPPNQLMASGRQNVLDDQQTISAHSDSLEEQPAKYPQYAVKNTRINSFQGWPAELRQRPEEMAECGFYYAGFSDCVRCFHCGVGLRNWMSEDDPWIEHARWSTECIYVLKMKGEEFVSLVKMAVEIAEREEAERSNGGKNQASKDSNETAPTAVIQEGNIKRENLKVN
ncbi:hypothetical protein CHS0354_018242 [Potamilus streckersoni]|uniref:Uncharacterized protein n=1 Tax=Potamilus streckersoni TaxID=2493646 RepID=A0AAE0VY03_9BIVA|nr:hypothetical protein CHS0354_018242 [Potamilus streckersoni]